MSRARPYIFQRRFFRFRVLILILLVVGQVHAGWLQPVSTADPSIGVPAGGDADSFAPLINSNATHVLFASSADNLVTLSNGGSVQLGVPSKINLYLRNRTNSTTVLVSQNLTGAGGDGDSFPDDLSADGNLALFESSADDLVPQDTNGVADIFLRNLTNDSTMLISISSTGGAANGVSRSACMTPDGRFVAFVSEATNLVGPNSAATDSNNIPDIYVRDLQSNTTVLVSVGAKPYFSSGGFGNGSESPEISADGRYVAFSSNATNLIGGVTITGQIYVRDLIAGTTAQASSFASNALYSVLSATNGVCYNHALSSDGQFVFYETSRASGTRNPGIILRYHVSDGTTDIISTNAFVPFDTAYDLIRTLDISPDGHYVAFIANTNGNSGSTTCVQVWNDSTGSLTLASGDTNNAVPAGSTCEWPTLDASGRYVLFARGYIYLRDLQLGVTTQLTVNDTNAFAFDSALVIPRISANGQTAVAACGVFGGNLNVFALDVATTNSEFISSHVPVANGTANGNSYLSPWAISESGRYVAFSSYGKNVVANDTNSNRDVFVHDLYASSNVLVSIGINGGVASGASGDAAISPDGRFVAFTSTATNLVASDTNGTQDVYVADLQTGAIVLGSVATSGTMPGNGPSSSPRLSKGGRYLLFRSEATTLTSAPYAAGTVNLFLRDLVTSSTIALSTNGVFSADMTPDGHYIAYVVTNSFLYVWDTQQSKRIYTNTTAGGGFATISSDGSKVAFATGNRWYVATRQSNSTWTASSIAALSSTRGLSAAFSANAQTMVYDTGLSQSPNYLNAISDVYLYDFSKLSTTIISHPYDDLQASGNSVSDRPSISADGRFIIFRSAASRIVAGITNRWPQLYIYDRVNGTNGLFTPNSNEKGCNGLSMQPLFSADGRTVIFSSWASDLTGADFNQAGDLFAFTFLYANVNFNNISGGATLLWPTVPGHSYAVQYKDVLAGAWQTLTGGIVFSGNTATIEDPTATTQRFYRVISY